MTFDVDVGGERLASGVNDSPVTLPPMQSVSLPFSVATTTRNLGAQLGSIFGTGTIPYTVSGHVVLRDFSLIGIPYSVAGRVTPADLAGGLSERGRQRGRARAVQHHRTGSFASEGLPLPWPATDCSSPSTWAGRHQKDVC